MLSSFRNVPALKRALAPVAASLAAVVGVVGFSAPAHAEFEQGDYELRLSGFGQNDVNFDAFTANMSAQLGYFLTDTFELGVRQDINYTDAGPGSNLSGGTAVFANFHFGNRGDALQPFIGANLGYLYGDNVNETFVAGPEIGLKYFFYEQWFLFAQAEYQFFFDNGDEADESIDDGVFNYRLGLGVILGPNK